MKSHLEKNFHLYWKLMEILTNTFDAKLLQFMASAESL